MDDFIIKRIYAKINLIMQRLALLVIKDNNRVFFSRYKGTD